MLLSPQIVWCLPVSNLIKVLRKNSFGLFVCVQLFIVIKADCAVHVGLVSKLSKKRSLKLQGFEVESLHSASLTHSSMIFETLFTNGKCCLLINC